jgi:hypothetical protein
MAKGWTTMGFTVRFPVGSRILSFFPIVETGSGAHQASYLIRTGVLSTEVKQLEREADHSPPTSAEIKKIWIYRSIPPYVFML